MNTIDTASAVAAAGDAAGPDPAKPEAAVSDGRRKTASEASSGNLRSLVLVGLMGAGKSSVGRRLAARLGFSFVDADTEIEKAAGASIQEIFAEHGETAFRDGERKVIARLLEQPRIVLATGGGAYMNAETRTRIRDRGFSIWLKADLDVLVRRCSRRTHRPLLQNGDIRGTLARLMEQRYPVYAEADVSVISGDGPHENVVDDILLALPEQYRQVAGTIAPDDRVAPEGQGED